MAFQCGFFNSVNGDRKYNAEQMNYPYKRIISNGVFANPDGTPSDDFQVQVFNGMTVKVKTGEGIFFDKWGKLDGEQTFTVPPASVSQNRIDSIFVKIDISADVRAGSIIYKQGTASATPQAPEIVRNDTIKEYRLANILVNANTTAITQSKIVDTRPSADCGFVTHLVAQPDLEATYIQWQAEFEEWFLRVKDSLARATLMRSYNSTYTTTTPDQTEIPINIREFNRDLDILNVYINGLRLIPGQEYEVIDNTRIDLENGVDRGTPVSFVVYKSIDDADSVQELVYQIQSQVNTLLKLRFTSDTGSTKYSVLSGEDFYSKFLSFGKGYSTIYVQSGATNVPITGAFRAIGHLTGDEVGQETGWVMLFNATGAVYTNYLNGGAWRGWRSLFEVNPAPLYISQNGVFPNNGVEITPEKSLSQCQHGWQLVFTGYDDTERVPRDYYTQTVLIPKRSYKNTNWNGESTAFSLVCVYGSLSESITHCVKVFNVYDNKLVSGTANSTGESRKMVLRAIYEY